ncbi:MAG: tetratricopeptide repeat protein [Pseudomonadota bacterium]
MSIANGAIAAQSKANDKLSPARLESLREASAKGSVTAMVKLAGIYLSGQSVPRDPERALDLYRRAAALGDADAIFHLGNMYLLGEGIPRDDAQAFRLFEKAAGQGHPLAIQNYESLKQLVKPEEGVTNPKADKQSELDQQRAINIARRHGIRIDFSGTIDPTANTEAIEPDLTPLDTDEPLEMLEQSENEQAANEDYKLAETLYFGDASKRDEAQAIGLYRRAARAGHTQALTRLLSIYGAAGIEPPRCENPGVNPEICF